MRPRNRESSSYSKAMTSASMELKAERVAETKAMTDTASAFVLALMAGGFVALGSTFMLVVQADASLSFAVSRMLGAFGFCVGLFLVLGAGAELFTGNSLMIIGVLSGRFSWTRLIRSWLVVLVGNACGACLVAVLMVAADVGALGDGSVAQAAMSLAESKLALSIPVAFARGILCNLLVCLAVWVSYAAHSVTDKFFAALLPVMTFVVCGFEHSVANMFFFPYALMLQLTGVAASVSISAVVVKLAVVILGNLVGGVCLVGVSYWFAYGRPHVKEERGETA